MLRLAFALVLCCAALAAAAPPGHWVMVRQADGVWRQVFVHACEPAGPAPYPPRPAADVRPELPAGPVSVAPPAPKPQPSLPPPQKRPRPEPEVFRLESVGPFQVEPTGPGIDAIAAGLKTLAEQLKPLPAWPPAFPGSPTVTANANANANAAAASTSTAPESPAARAEMPAASANASAQADSKAAASSTSIAPKPRLQNPVSGSGSIVAQWAQDLLGYGLTALAAAAGIALPGGVVGVAAWLGWRFLRRAIARKVAAPKLAFPSQNLPTLPHLPVDYAKIWADHYEKDGGNAQHEAIKCDLYREAVQLVRDGKLQVLGDPVRTADAIDNWVFREFSERVSKMVPDVNVYQRALLGFLYRQAIDAIRRGEIQVYGPAETAEAIETWVRREFAARLVHS